MRRRIPHRFGFVGADRWIGYKFLEDIMLAVVLVIISLLIIGILVIISIISETQNLTASVLEAFNMNSFTPARASRTWYGCLVFPFSGIRGTVIKARGRNLDIYGF